MSLATLKAFLTTYHDDVMDRERRALAVLDTDADAYRALMREKAELMSKILKAAGPELDTLSEEERAPIYATLRSFAGSAAMGLRLNSPFYWSALLYDDDAKPGDPDNLIRYINTL